MLEINEIKSRIFDIMKSDSISLYELALDIGISHSSLYNLTNPRYGITKDIQTKVSDFVENYQTKDEKINKYQTCLAEIKEIASRVFVFGALISIIDIKKDYEQILQKIAECEVE